ncbi:MAG TPA: carboxylesterase family protein, partial [Acidimicrobiales bacterium]|nr:carboxylesterase family protein [Acidimicrobiales bacterium]
MVWVHGGAFTIGASSLSTYDPTRLVAEHGVVFVAPNYRLGALGFLALPAGRERGVLPNVGLTDVLLALRWVGQNARAFGGDPGRVTVFGESAGAGAILHLLGAPGAEGLFRRAILQSPGVAQTLDAGQGALAAADLLGRLGIDPDAADVGERLRAVDPVRLLDAQSASVAALSTTLGAMPFHPVVDGELVRDMPLEVLGSGAARDVELVVGTTADEMRLFSSPALAQLDRQRLVRVLQPVVARAVGRDIGADSVDLLVKQYETWLGDDGGADRVWAAVMTDGLMRLPAEAAVTAHAAHQDGVYTYSFAWQPRGPAAHLGAFHAIDLPFTFGTFDREGWGEMLGADAGAHDVSRAMRSAWAAFAAGGDPGPGLAGGWPRWDDDRRTTLVLGDPVTLVEDPLAERRQAWEALGHG